MGAGHLRSGARARSARRAAVSIRFVDRWRVHLTEALAVAIFIAIAVLTIIAIVNGEELPS